MKKFVIILSVLFLTQCSNHIIKIGKRCTHQAYDSSYEKSFIWFVKKTNLESFDQKINRLNCERNEKKT